MAEPNFADLDPRQDFERGWNRLQLIIEVTVGLVVIAGLAGLLGSGPLSSRVEHFRNAPLEMTYQRILRRTVETEITIKIERPLNSDSIEVQLPNKLIDNVDIATTSPRSTSMRAEANGVVYVFALGKARLGTITFFMKARTPGPINSVVKTDGAEAPLQLFVLP